MLYFETDTPLSLKQQGLLTVVQWYEVLSRKIHLTI